jgi:hypothetical protein
MPDAKLTPEQIADGLRAEAQILENEGWPCELLTTAVDTLLSEHARAEDMRRQRDEAYGRCEEIVREDLPTGFAERSILRIRALKRAVASDAASAPPAAPAE